MHPLIKIALLIVIMASRSERTEPDRPPNIVMILVDDLGYQDAGYFGDSTIFTPNIDAIFRQGIRLTDFYAWPVCTPSRSAFFTGRYPQRNGLYENIRNNMVNYGHRYTPYEYSVSPEMTLGLDRREITIGQALQKAGYTTGIVGKWDMGSARRFLPLQRGFDYFFGFGNNGIDYWTHERYGAPSMFQGDEPVKVEGYATVLFRDHSLKFIDENKDRPFFLLTAFNAPHSASNLEKDRYQAPEEYIELYGIPPGTNRMRHKAMISCMDEAVGQIIGKLKEHALRENTLIVFASDNGGTSIGNNGPLRGHKGLVYEGGVRVMFAAMWPGKIPKGIQKDNVCSMLDLFPTFLEVAGADSAEGTVLDGQSLLPVLTNDIEEKRVNNLFWEFRGQKAARVGDWKWVKREDQKQGELYDLSDDTGEHRDLAKEMSDTLKLMESRWQNWRQQMEEAEPRGPFRNY